MEKDAYLLELSRFIHLNPWRVNRGRDPIKYRWSSLGPYVGTRAAPSWLTVRELMSQFGSKGKRGYWQFVAEGIKQGIRTPWDELRGQAVMGSEEFVQRVMKRHGGKAEKKTEIVGRKELVGVKPEVIMAAVGKYYGIEPEAMKGRGRRYTEPRYVASYLMRRYGFMGLREIGERVGLHFSAVGNSVQRVANHATGSMAQSVRESSADSRIKSPDPAEARWKVMPSGWRVDGLNPIVVLDDFPTWSIWIPAIVVFLVFFFASSMLLAALRRQRSPQTDRRRPARSSPLLWLFTIGSAVALWFMTTSMFLRFHAVGLDRSQVELFYLWPQPSVVLNFSDIVDVKVARAGRNAATWKSRRGKSVI